MTTSSTLTVLAAAAFCCTLQASVIPVTTADNLRSAIESAADGDVVQVSAGTHTLDGEAVVPSGVTVSGAGVGLTVLTSSNAGARCLSIGPNAVVEGLTVQGQKITTRSLVGRGVYLTGGTLRNCRVTGFSAGQYFQYGTVCVDNANAVVENCEIDNNDNCHGNDALNYGGGVFLKSGRVTGCRIHDNASNTGAGVYMTGGTLENCHVFANRLRYMDRGNATMGTGAGVWASGGTVTGCRIVGNAATTYSGIGGIHLANANVTMADTLVRGNVSYNDTSVGFPDFSFASASVETKVSGCRLPVAFGADCDTAPVFFTSDWQTCPFTADRTEAFVGETITFRATDGSGWTVSEDAGVHDVSATVGGVDFTAAKAVRFCSRETSVSTAADLAAAVACAVDGATIRVAAGTYVLDRALIVDRAVTIEGAGMFETVLTLKDKVSDRVLMLADAGAVVSRLTLKGGRFGIYGGSKANGAYDVYGITAWIGHRGGTLSECRVTGGKTGNHYQKGNLAVTGADGRAVRCLVDNNDNCFQLTSGNGWGGAIFVSAGLVESCLVTNNYAYTGGGAFVQGGVLRNCTFFNNRTLEGSAVNAAGGTVLNCVSGGSATSKNPSAGSPEWGGSAACFDTCAFVGLAADKLPGATSLAVADPFVSSVRGDLHPAPGEAGLQDKGKDFAGSDDALDFEGKPRKSGSTVDVGCYENDASLFTCAFTCATVQGFVGESFSFASELGNPPAGETFEYAWTFDNGNGGTVRSADSNPAIPLGIGRWTATLTVTSSSGRVATSVQENCVLVAVRHLYASADAEAAFPYDEPSKGTSDLAALLALTLDGSTIHFAAGEYAVGAEVVLNSGVVLSGAGMFETVLSLTAKNGRLLTLNHPDAVCEKLTLKGGALDVRSDQGDGYGITVKIGENGGTLRACRVTGGKGKNHFQYGNIAVVGADGHVDACLVDGNENLFQSTSGDGYGAGIYVGAGLVENCLVTNNYAFTGGGAYVKGGLLRNCTFYANDALRSGGVYASAGRVVNCVMAYDTSLSTKDSFTGRPEWGGTGSCFENCAFVGIDADKLPGSSSFLVGNPFVNPTAGDLSPASVANGLKDRGADYDGAADARDFLGNPRLSGAAVDIGCIEANAVSFTCSADAAPQVCFVGQEVAFSSVLDNAPAGATIAYDWKITDRFGRVTEAHEANPVLQLPAGWYTVELTARDAANPSVAASATPLADYIHVAVRDSYATCGNAAAEYPYDSPEKGSTNIVELLAEAVSGTTVHVGEGCFTNVDEMVIMQGVTLVGAGRDRTTVRLGKYGRRVLTLGHPAAVCEKMTLTGGTLAVDYNREAHFGTGVWIMDMGGTLRDCRVTGNVAYGYYQYGGGVYMSGPGLVDRCIVEGNTNIWREVDAPGGGVAAACGEIRNCLIRNNTATSGGGAWIYGEAVMRNCTLVGNCAVRCPSRYNYTVVDGVVVDLYGGGYGGGLKMKALGGRVENCVFLDNTSYHEGYAGAPEWQNEDGSVAFVSTAFPEGVALPGAGTRNVGDPCFANPSAGDYRLTVRSPLRNAGTTATGQAETTDLDGNARVWGKAVDIGCYELPWGLGLKLILR